MKRKDAKIGMTVIVTGRNYVNAYSHCKDNVYLKKGDKVVIVGFMGHGFEERFSYLSTDGQPQSFTYADVEPCLEAKPQEKQTMKMPEFWYCSASKSMLVALEEMGKTNGFKMWNKRQERSTYICNVHCYPNQIGFGGGDIYDQKYITIPLSQVVEFLSVPQEKPLTMGGKEIVIKDKEIVVGGVTISLEKAREIYKRVKEGPIFVGENWLDMNIKNGKVVGITIGCTKGTIEEVEALAKKLRF